MESGGWRVEGGGWGLEGGGGGTNGINGIMENWPTKISIYAMKFYAI